MRSFVIVLFGLILSSASLAQTSVDDFKFIGKFDFDNPNERILAYKLRGDRLEIVGSNTFQLWDTANDKVLASRHHDIQNLTVQSFGGANPEQNKILVLGGKDFAGKTFPTSVWNAETGKRIAILDKAARPIVSAAWSKNGATLVTASSDLLASASYMNHEKQTEICFWDGETLAFRGAALIDDLTWFYLSGDGAKFFTTSVPTKKGLFGIPFVSGMANVIKIWNARTAKTDEILSVGDDDFATLTWKLMPSPDGRYFALVSKSKSSDREHRVLVWEIGGALSAPKYVVKANPKVSESSLGYSPDGKYFALDAGRNVQIYELASGKLKYQLNDADVPHYWLDDDKIALYNYADKIKAFTIPGGKPVFEEKVAYQTVDVPNGVGTTDENGNYKQETTTETVDYTRIAAAPNGRFFIAYSNRSVKVYDARTGENLRTLVSPPLIFEKKKKILGVPLPKSYNRNDDLVKDAGWLAGGKTIYVLDAQGKSISLWKFNG